MQVREEYQRRIAQNSMYLLFISEHLILSSVWFWEYTDAISLMTLRSSPFDQGEGESSILSSQTLDM